jgi:TonB-dependent starch-binding outer membrane protein SusC
MNAKLPLQTVRKLIWLIPFLFCWNHSIAQHQVNGTVIDANTSETLPGVSILVLGTDQGTSTNLDGEFQLDVPSSESILVFTYVGYARQEVSINGRTELEIGMISEILAGEEIVVIGYGTQRIEHLTGSVSAISAQQVSEISVPTVTHA